MVKLSLILFVYSLQLLFVCSVVYQCKPNEPQRWLLDTFDKDGQAITIAKTTAEGTKVSHYEYRKLRNNGYWVWEDNPSGKPQIVDCPQMSYMLRNALNDDLAVVKVKGKTIPNTRISVKTKYEIAHMPTHKRILYEVAQFKKTHGDHAMPAYSDIPKMELPYYYYGTKISQQASINIPHIGMKTTTDVSTFKQMVQDDLFQKHSGTQNHEYVFIVMVDQPDEIRFFDWTLAHKVEGKELVDHTSLLSKDEYIAALKWLTTGVKYAGEFTISPSGSLIEWSNDSGYLFLANKFWMPAFAHHWGLSGISMDEYDHIQAYGYDKHLWSGLYDSFPKSSNNSDSKDVGLFDVSMILSSFMLVGVCLVLFFIICFLGFFIGNGMAYLIPQNVSKHTLVMVE